MKNIVKLIFALMLVWSAPILKADDDDDYDISLTEVDDDGDDNVKNDDKHGGHRSAPMLTPCTISHVNGVTIFSVAGQVEILSYEIWATDSDTCLGVYGDERMFLDALYADNGEYMVVFTTADKKYKGYIWIQ